MNVLVAEAKFTPKFESIKCQILFKCLNRHLKLFVLENCRNYNSIAEIKNHLPL